MAFVPDPCQNDADKLAKKLMGAPQDTPTPRQRADSLVSRVVKGPAVSRLVEEALAQPAPKRATEKSRGETTLADAAGKAKVRAQSSQPRKG